MNKDIINSFSLVGNIAKVNEIKEMSNGNKFRYFTIAQNNKYKTKSGEQKDEALFFDIKIYENKFKEFESILNVGQYVHILGKINIFKDEENKTNYSLIGTNGRSLNREKYISDEIFDYDWLNEGDDREMDNVI